jgi:hypothetical protein
MTVAVASPRTFGASPRRQDVVKVATRQNAATMLTNRRPILKLTDRRIVASANSGQAESADTGYPTGHFGGDYRFQPVYHLVFLENEKSLHPYPAQG